MNEGFSADFSQQVISPEGETVMEGEGSVEIARPSLFRWSTTFPDENLLVSDGKLCGTTARLLSKLAFTGKSKRPSKHHLCS